MRPVGLAALAGVLLALFPILTAAQGGPPDAEQVSHVEGLQRSGVVDECEVPGLPPPVFCGELAVPESRFRPRSDEERRVVLRYVLLPAREPVSTAAPIVVLEGGPGASVSGVAVSHFLTFRAFLDDHDLILLDQRGTGHSSPLDCPGGPSGSSSDRASRSPDWAASCREAVPEGTDRLAYTTAAAVEDLDDLRRHLGYPKLHLFAVSYGTRTALVYLREHGDHVASATLLGPYPLDENVPQDAAAIAQRSLDLLFQECAVREGCRQAFPDLPGAARRLVAHLSAGQPAGAASDELPSRTEVTSTVRLMLFSPLGAARVPLVIHRAAAGDFGPYREVRGELEGQFGSWISRGTFLTILCSEDVARLDPKAMARRAEGTFFGSGWSESLMAACRAWGHAELPSSFWEPVRGVKAPVLLLSGELDPSMPPRWAEELAERLPNARAVIIPEGQHSLIGMNGIGCVLGLIERTIRTGSIEGLDTSCVTAMSRPPFVLPED